MWYDMEMTNITKTSWPYNCLAIKARGEDGAFYDLVYRRYVGEHLKFLREGGCKAAIVNRDDVPPCIVRVFQYGGNTCEECRYEGGEDRYFPEEAYDWYEDHPDE